MGSVGSMFMQGAASGFQSKWSGIWIRESLSYFPGAPSPALEVVGRNSTAAKLAAEAALNEWVNDDRSERCKPVRERAAD